MALSAAIVWEVRTSGVSTNGGGFKSGATGTDWTVQDAAQYSVTDGVTAGTTTITSATAAFGTDVVGNVIYVAGGTGSVTAGWYEITARTNSTTITVDRSTGLTAGTGVTLKIGGAMDTPATAAAVAVGQNLIWLKSGTYSVAAGFTLAAGAAGGTKTTLNGYGSTRGDNGTKPVIQASAGSFTMATLNGDGCLRFVTLDGNSQTSIRGVVNAQNDGLVYRCLLKNFTNGAAVGTNARFRLVRCEVTGCATATALQSCKHIVGCHLHDNTVSVVGTNDPLFVVANVFANNTGASTDGVVAGAVDYQSIVWGNVFYACGRHAIATAGARDPGVFNNIFYLNGGYGIKSATFTGQSKWDLIDFNAFGSNTSGAVETMGTPGNNNVALTADPFTNAAAGDFSLNNTAGGGAACRAAGFPGAFPGGTTTGYVDVGAAQSQAAGGPVGASRIIQNIGTY